MNNYFLWFDDDEGVYDCCVWERVQCDKIIGYVINLDFSRVVEREVFVDNKMFCKFNVILFCFFREFISFDLFFNIIICLVEGDGIIYLLYLFFVVYL